MTLLEQRFWAKVNKTASCWLWTGFVEPGGYGRFGHGGDKQSQLAHRRAYEFSYGPIAAGFTLDHLCRVRHCVNPGHLEPVSMRENTKRGENHVAKYMIQQHCKNGHEYSEENTYYRHRDGFTSRVCRKCRRKAQTIYRLSRP